MLQEHTCINDKCSTLTMQLCICKGHIVFEIYTSLKMDQDRTKSKREIINYVRFINQIPPETIKSMRWLKRINTKICRQKICILFHLIWINEEMLLQYTTHTHPHTHTHTHTYIHIYIYIYIYIYIRQCMKPLWNTWNSNSLWYRCLNPTMMILMLLFKKEWRILIRFHSNPCTIGNYRPPANWARNCIRLHQIASFHHKKTYEIASVLQGY